MEKSNKGLYIALVVLIVLLLILSGYIVYDKLLSNKNDTSSIENNVVEDIEDNDNLEIVSEIPSDIYGTYYNNVKYENSYAGDYFTLKSDGYAEIAHCIDSSILFTVKYKISYINDVLTLLIDTNNDGKYLEKYLVLKETDGYRFKPVVMG